MCRDFLTSGNACQVRLRRGQEALEVTLPDRASDNRICNMKTIAVTVDEATLKILDELAGHAPRGRTRSALVRAALREFADRERRRVVEERERGILRKHRTRLARDARGLVRAQARP